MRKVSPFIYTIALLLLPLSPKTFAIPILSYFENTNAESSPGEFVVFSGRKHSPYFKDINDLLATSPKDSISYTEEIIQTHGESGLAYEVLGTAYTVLSSPEKAIEFYKKAILIEPKHEDSYIKLSSLLMEKDELDLAEKFLKAVLKVNPNNRHAYQRLGYIYEYTKKDKLAISAFAKGLQGTPPNYIGVAVNLGRLLNKYDKYAQTISYLAPRLNAANNNSNFESHLILATAYLGIGENEKAFIHFQHSLKYKPNNSNALLGKAMALAGSSRLKEAHFILDQLISENPEFIDAHLEKAKIYLAEGNLSAAETSFSEAIKHGVPIAKTKRILTKYYINNRNFEKAKRLLQELIDKYQSPIDYIALSEVLLADGKTSQGFQILLNGLKHHPDNTYLKLRAGSYLASIRKYDQAIPYLEEVHQVSRQNPELLKAYATVLSKAGQSKKAAETIKNYYQQNPEDVELALFYALRLEESGEYLSAIKVYKKALKIQPKNPVLLNNLANNYAKAGQLDDAKQLAEEAINIIPNNSRLLDTLGWIQYKMGFLDEAQSTLYSAIQLEPKNGMINYHYAQTLISLQRNKEAQTYLQKALKNATDHDLKLDIERLLSSIN